MRKVYQEVQDRFEDEGYIYRQDLRNMLDKLVEFNQSFKLQDLRNMLDKLVEFNQSFKLTHETLVGKIE